MPKSSSTRRTDDASSNAEQTRAALVRAALKLFGTVGYDGASTREIAAAANANIGSIAYHFGGKEGLRLAVADYIVLLMQGLAARAAADAPPMPAASAQAAEEQLAIMLERMFGFFVASPEAGEIVPFVLREMSAPTAAFERIYAGVFEPLHRRFCGVWEIATGDPADSEETKISVFTLIGQVVYFRLAREAVMRRMGWRELGPKEVSAVAAVAGRNLRAAIQAHRSARQS